MIRNVVLVGLVLLSCSCASTRTPDSQGMVGGGMVGSAVGSKDDIIKQQEEIIHRQQLQLEQQKRELDDLNRQVMRNNAMQPYAK